MTTVLVVDDSALMRKVMRGYFEQAGMDVVTARDGEEALQQVAAARPDVVTLDVHMPRMDGLACLSHLMARALPVVMVSVMTTPGAQATLKALELGAVDFVAKPDAAISLRLGDVRVELVEKVQRAAMARPRQPQTLRKPRTVAAAGSVSTPGSAGWKAPKVGLPEPELVLVGSSTGGPGALVDLIRDLPTSFPPMVVAQHLPALFTRHLAGRLDGVGAVRVTEVTTVIPLEPGTVYLGRGEADVIVTRRGGRLVAKSVPSGVAYPWHPSVDRLVRSALDVLPAERMLGVLLTGMGDDGASAMAELSEGGGRTIAESEETAVVWGMPGSLVRKGGADAVLPAHSITAQLLAWASLTSPISDTTRGTDKEHRYGTHS